MPELDLDADAREQFVGALLGAFNAKELDRVLRRFDRPLDEVTAPGPLRDRFEEVLDLAQREGWTAELLEASRVARPQRLELQELASDLGAGPAGRSRLERTVRAEHGIRDFGVFQAGMDNVERRVCRIDVRNEPQGTGFLVGPDVVMTNYHVVEHAVDEGIAGGLIQAVFGYKTMPDGRRVDAGTAVHAADGSWLVGWSRSSPLDEQPYDPDNVPTDDYLDFALVGLASPIGREPAHPGEEHRGWYELTDAVPALAKGNYLLIAQHARGERLQFDDGFDAVLGLNKLGTRVQYTVNTEPGSSGSPCFDVAFNLVALHHSGDPNYSSVPTADYNEGIPTATIFGKLGPELRDRLRR
jgi:hypothetical protein